MADFLINITNQHPIIGDLYSRYDEMGQPPSPPGTTFLVAENGDRLVTEDQLNYIIE